MLRAAAKATQTYRTSGAKLKKAGAKALDEFSEQLEDHAAEIDEVEICQGCSDRAERNQGSAFISSSLPSSLFSALWSFSLPWV